MDDWKRDTMVQAWVDRRDLATCCLALKALGYHPRNASEIVALVMNSIAQQQETRIETTQEAIEMLDGLGIQGNLNPCGRGLGNLRRNLMRGVEEASEDDIEKVVKQKMEELEREKQKR